MSPQQGDGTSPPAEPSDRGFFSRFKKRKITKIDQPDGDGPAPNVKSEESLLKPVSFTTLFRFSTRFELCLNFIGLIAAVVAGAAQPLMTLLFGDLTQGFVDFGTILNEAQQGIPGAAERIPGAAANFRQIAAKDAGYLALIGVGIFVCTYIYMSIWAYTAEVTSKRLRERYLRAVLRQNIAFFDNVGAGEVATRIQTDTHLVQQGISEKVPLSLSFISAFLTGFTLAYIRCWRLALPLTAVLPCIGITGGIMNKFVSQYLQMSLKHVADGGSFAEEVISTIRTAQAFGTQHTLSELYDTFIEKAHKIDLKASVFHGGGLAVFFFVIYSAYGLTFSFGTTLLNRGQATAGQIVNVFLAILIGSFSLALLAPEMQAIINGRGAAAKLFETIDRIPEIDSASPDGAKPEKVEGEIVFENVTFNYPSRPEVTVVKNLSLKFPAGKTAAIVGASGSGKSTIVSLVERFYDPIQGIVRLDGTNIRDLNVKWLRSQIGLVSQEPILFATSIKNNVAHGLIGTEFQNLPDEEKFDLIKEACIKANADGFISKLPLGYDTMVGERGYLLSGGQKQRVAIARAIVSDPRILLLDEATSALDTQSEGIVQDALDKAAAGRTTITIAHRLSTIKDAACIFVMGEGGIIDQGTHNQLLQDDNSAYSRLVQAQRLRERQTKQSSDDDEAASDEGREMEIAAMKEEPLGRKNTGRSLGSEILEQKREAGEDTDKTKEHGMAYLFMRMGKINNDQWLKYLFGTTFAIMTGMVYPAFGIVYAKGIDGFTQTSAHVRQVDNNRTALWLFLIAVASGFTIGIQNLLFASSAASLTSKLRSLTFRSVLRQDIEFFDEDENSTGSLTSNLSDGPQKISGLAGISLGAIVQSIATIIAGSVIGLAFVWKLALVAIACTPFLISVGYIRLRVVVLKDQKNKVAHEQSAHLACEASGSIRTVAALTREDDCCEIYSRSLEQPMNESNQTAIWSNLLFAISQGFMFFVIALVFWYGARLVSFREYAPSRFFIGLMSTTFGAIQAGNVFAFVPDVSLAKGAASGIIKLIDNSPEIDAESTEGRKLEAKTILGHIRFDDVHFRYPTRPDVRVLRGLSFHAEPGNYIALVGASGCGKSTVIQLIERFYDPLAGGIYLDDHPIAELNIQDYRQNFALVSQEPTLYAGTIRFNVLLGAIKPHSEVTQEEIEDACRSANILDFINELPKGFETQVGGKGSQLSGGQKQRIAIARALLRNPKVLLLDEATSALDSNSEKVVQEALDHAAKGRTTIAIAHRLSTIQNANRIYFIKEGRISESGTHDQLLALRGDYYEYVQLQVLSKKV